MSYPQLRLLERRARSPRPLAQTARPRVFVPERREAGGERACRARM